MNAEKEHPAYTGRQDLSQDPNSTCAGVSLRDYFAAQAMQGEIACKHLGYDMGRPTDIDELAVLAYKIADSMMKVRES